jgi:hypothetical protein
LLLFSKVSKLIPKIIGHPKKQLLYIVKIHEKIHTAQLAKNGLGTTQMGVNSL